MMVELAMLHICMLFKNKNSVISNEKSQKSKGGKSFLVHTEEQRNQLLVGMKARATRHQFNKRNCEIFIIKERWDTNVHVIDYQI